MKPRFGHKDSQRKWIWKLECVPLKLERSFMALNCIFGRKVLSLLTTIFQGGAINNDQRHKTFNLLDSVK